jgi:hypothetical protein
MDAEKLKKFVNRIANIKATVPGTPMSSAAYEGTTGPRDDMLRTLRNNVSAFAAEYSKSAPKTSNLQPLADAIEGGLYGLRSLSILTDAEMDSFLQEFEELKK